MPPALSISILIISSSLPGAVVILTINPYMSFLTDGTDAFYRAFATVYWSIHRKTESLDLICNPNRKVFTTEQTSILYATTLVSVHRSPAPLEPRLSSGEPDRRCSCVSETRRLKHVWTNRRSSDCSLVAWIFRISRHRRFHSHRPGC